jgi:hypothetical protein
VDSSQGGCWLGGAQGASAPATLFCSFFFLMLFAALSCRSSYVISSKVASKPWAGRVLACSLVEAPHASFDDGWHHLFVHRGWLHDVGGVERRDGVRQVHLLVLEAANTCPLRGMYAMSAWGSLAKHKLHMQRFNVL